MTFTEAYIMASKESKEFCKIKKEIHKRSEDNGDAICLLFSIGTECFWYGWDGCDIVRGKHSGLVSHRLITSGQTLVIA